MTDKDKDIIAFGDFLHDNYYGLQGGWRTFFPVNFEYALSTEKVYQIYVEHCKNLKDE